MSENRRTYLIVNLTITGAFILLLLFDEWQFNLWKNAIPSGLEISRNIDVGAEYGLLSGCGFAVYVLSDDTLSAISKQGVKAIEKFRYSEVENYSEWSATPYLTSSDENQSRDFWQMGMSCGSPRMDEALRNKIEVALGQPGSYYTFGSHSGIVVLPENKLVIISTWG